MHQLIKLSLKFSSVLAISSVLASHSLASPSELISQHECEACHGPNGVSSDTNIPTIAGIPEFNFFDQMLRYLEGRPSASVNHVYGDTSQKKGDMVTIVKSLSEAQIEELAKHYAGLEFVPAKQSFDQALAMKGKAIHAKSCENCHSDGGSNALDEASILAGQQKGYLATTLQQFKQGKRSVDKKMDEAFKGLSSDDINALVEYYASYR
ncbi:c-type cytochrome [Vibrio parahaemolyticus]|uniref:c-type cytochrome n=1 Tax=Vibrio parahaemolyticus TaxID=670 RepID=UPI0004726A28|nr:c-type cytochrome [Vibrio parahaemolyticus]EGR0068173.1 cytochrome c-553 [Vibrio parahaemolyticus]EGR3322068.1 cytochrome c-553 [Vibrio parahaemolyticus]EKH9210173.1 c-type cytochrome [Vibrio parahaemolyticus]MBY4651479.1 c-type cytochrome [Vibrio parahaemolyticus]MCC4208714.1 c-type cytochrome [Vibrio parahaemolyticus]